MNNFEKMKKSLIKQIEGMTVDECYNFTCLPQ
jgi:hypothetical protein